MRIDWRRETLWISAYYEIVKKDGDGYRLYTAASGHGMGRHELGVYESLQAAKDAAANRS